MVAQEDGMKFLVIGYGGIGKQRVKALLRLKEEGCRIEDVFVYDPALPLLLPDGVFAASQDTFIDNPPDWVFVATPHNLAVEWVKVALSWGSRVLMEKPFGRNFTEALSLYSKTTFPDQLFLGFNYRFYDGVARLREDIIGNSFGKLTNITMTLGHGGKPSDATSWKLDRFTGAPDSLLDPGIHFLDLLNWMFPRTAIPLAGKSTGGFWGTDVKEEVVLLLDINGCPTVLNSSIVKWRNTFHIEVQGRDGYGILDGRGGNYGTQRYTTGKRWAWMMGAKQRDTEKVVITCEGEDSFYQEVKSLLYTPFLNCSASNALDVMMLYTNSARLVDDNR